MTTPAPLQALLGINRTVHAPARLLLLSLLFLVSEADFLYLESQTGLTRGNLSSHLAKLEAADLIDVQKTFQDRRPNTVYRITKVGRSTLQHYLATLRSALLMLPE